MTTFLLRPFRKEDAAATAEVFRHAVREGSSPYYDERQRDAWAARLGSLEAWTERLSRAFTVVAQREERLVGFMSLLGDLLDLAYVLPEERGRGTAAVLYDEVEREARRNGVSELRSDASELFRRFLERRGWHVVARRHPVLDGVTLTHWRMRKALMSEAP